MCRDPECGTCNECVDVDRFNELSSALIAECSEFDQFLFYDGGRFFTVGGINVNYGTHWACSSMIAILVSCLNNHQGEWFQDLNQYANTVRYMTHNGFDPPGSEVYKHPAWFVCMRLQEIEDEKRGAKLMENNKAY